MPARVTPPRTDVHNEQRLPLALRLDSATQRLPTVTPGRLFSKLSVTVAAWESSKEIVVAVGTFFFAFALAKVAVCLPRRNAEGLSFRPVTIGTPTTCSPGSPRITPVVTKETGRPLFAPCTVEDVSVTVYWVPGLNPAAVADTGTGLPPVASCWTQGNVETPLGAGDMEKLHPVGCQAFGLTVPFRVAVVDVIRAGLHSW